MLYSLMDKIYIAIYSLCKKTLIHFVYLRKKRLELTRNVQTVRKSNKNEKVRTTYIAKVYLVEFSFVFRFFSHMYVSFVLFIQCVRDITNLSFCHRKWLSNNECLRSREPTVVFVRFTSKIKLTDSQTNKYIYLVRVARVSTKDSLDSRYEFETNESLTEW